MFFDKAFLMELRKVVTRASEAVLRIYTEKSYAVQSKGSAGPLTSADLEANRILFEGLTHLLPEAGWLSEETPDDDIRLNKKALWIVDPIDGTKDFIKGTGEFSVSVGLSVDGEAVIGAVALPSQQRIYYGGPDHGLTAESFYKGEFVRLPIRKSDVLDVKKAKILVSDSENRKGKFKKLNDFDIAPSGSIARKLAILAAGDGDLVLSLRPKNDWDICGGTALVRAIPDYSIWHLTPVEERRFNQNETISYGLVAGPEELCKQMLKVIESGNFSVDRNYD